MLARPLAMLLALVVLDYLAWGWATASGRAVPALVTGLALAPLAVTLAWVLLLTLLGGARRVGRGVTRRARDEGGRGTPRHFPRRRRRALDSQPPDRRIAA